MGTRKPARTKEKLNALLTETAVTKHSIEAVLPAEAVADAETCLLTVTDTSIEHSCELLAPNIKAGAVVAHCSGALDSTALNSASELGLKVCSLHPLNTFPNPAAALALVADDTHRTRLYCEGDASALDRCLPIFASLGFIPEQIQRDAKPLYHAACVFACNYLTVLMDLSMTTAGAARIDTGQFWRGLQPLIQSTLNNFSQRGAADSLSGPIARGDAKTVENHLQHLAAASSNLGVSYAEFGRHALRLAEQQGELSKSDLQELEKVLNS